MLLEDGWAQYKHFQLPVDGGLIEIGGGYDLLERVYALTVQLPGVASGGRLDVRGGRATPVLTPAEE